MSNLPPNMYNVKPDDIVKGMVIWTDDDQNGLGISEFKVEKNPTQKNNVMTLECVNLSLGVSQTIQINLRQPREIFTGKLVAGWRRI